MTVISSWISSRKIADIIDLNRTAPPESWTSEAAAKFGSTDAPDSQRSRIFGDLIFDSHLHTAEAVRSSIAETRHLIFDLFKYEVDLALEYSGRQLKLMMGQLLAKTADSADTCRIAVWNCGSPPGRI